MPPTDLQVEDLDDARFWLGVLHRRSIADCDRIVDLMIRLSWLEQPWWKRAFRRRPPRQVLPRG